MTLEECRQWKRERDEAQAMVEEFRLIYAKAVGRDDVTDTEAWAHMENVIFNARADARTEALLREKAENENVRLDRMLAHNWAERDALQKALLNLAGEYRSLVSQEYGYVHPESSLLTPALEAEALVPPEDQS